MEIVTSRWQSDFSMPVDGTALTARPSLKHIANPGHQINMLLFAMVFNSIHEI
jgi:hypothetical protein